MQNQQKVAKEITEELLTLIRQLLAEVHRQRQTPEGLDLDSTLDHDLGFDSLARMELFARVESRLGVVLPESTLNEAETPRDLLRAILAVHSTFEEQYDQQVSNLELEAVSDTPANAKTLLDVLKWHVDKHPERPHIVLYQDKEDGPTITYGDLWAGAQKVAVGLLERDLHPGDAVVLMLQANHDYFYSYIGTLLAGGVPVPIYPAPRASLLKTHLHRHIGILKNCRSIILVSQEDAKPQAELLKAQVDSLKHIVAVNDFSSSTKSLQHPVVGSRATALLQYTSGSTGDPKGVVLSHANLLANIRAMGARIAVTGQDVFVSWLPLYHDMGLIGGWLGSLYFATLLVVMSPYAFIARPQRWLQAIHRYRGTITAAPNFGYELCVRRLTDKHLRGLDLSSWRAAMNGAEPVSPKTMQQFSDRMRTYGVQPTILMPVYGLAENSVGLAFPPLGRGPLCDRVRRDDFMRKGRAIPTDKSDKHALEFMACGTPLDGHQVRIVDPSNRELPERHEGRLQFKGPSATSGYLRNPEANSRLFQNDWLDSADLAYMADGEIYLTGRTKDIIIRAGRNIYPHELEEAVGKSEGIRGGRVTAFGSTDPESGTERLIILAESREQDSEIKEKLRTQINTIVTELVGAPPDDVLLAPPHTILMTSSGKLRRSASRELYEKGRVDHPVRSPWVQIIRLSLSNLKARMQRRIRSLTVLLYGTYARSLLYLLAPLVWLAVMALPKIDWRWVLMSRVARLLARLTATPVSVTGLEHLLPEKQPCVFVVNHASYLDGYLLVGYLPRIFSFVAKGELRDSLGSRLFLERIGADFVERFDASKGLQDFKELAKNTRKGRSYLFFPEGTFTRSPGLLRFHMGAFIAAVEAGVPVVPIAIRGTRSILRGNDWLPYRGSIQLHISSPIFAENLVSESDDAWSRAIAMRDASRKAILKFCGEPDLIMEKPPF